MVEHIFIPQNSDFSFVFYWYTSIASQLFSCGVIYLGDMYLLPFGVRIAWMYIGFVENGETNHMHHPPYQSAWYAQIFYLRQSFEALNQRAVAVVVDPIQSVKGKVVIDAFRLINPQTMMLGQEPRQTTSNLGHLNKPSIQVSAEQISV